MGMDRETRRVQNSKQEKIGVMTSQPTKQQLREGQQVIHDRGNNTPRLYVKIKSKLYYIEFTEM